MERNMATQGANRPLLSPNNARQAGRHQ